MGSIMGSSPFIHTDTPKEKHTNTYIFLGNKEKQPNESGKNVLAAFIIQNEMLYMCFHALQSNTFKAFPQ